jgi:hypothetical protein
MTCRSACPTQDHDSFGQCCRSARLQIGSLAQRDYYKAWDHELDAYEAAVRQGIEPRTTKLGDTQAAVEFADETGIGDPDRWLASAH